MMDSPLFNNSEFQKSKDQCLKKAKKIQKKNKGKKKSDKAFSCGKEADDDWRNFLPYLKRKIIKHLKNYGLQDEPTLSKFY